MNLYKEIKQIAKKQEQIRYLISKLTEQNEEFEDYGIDWETATFVTLSKENIQYFKDHNGVTEDYFVIQNTGYCEDDFYGELYFKTDVAGQYVRVDFRC